MSNILILDTETTGLDKPFCYDVGYQIFDTKNLTIVAEKHFVIEQAWHNLPLFESAYYKEKRPQYVQLMRQHKATMTKWGYVMQEMRRDINYHNITDAYAYNADFDDKVFTYNCEWYKTMNPLDNVAIHDIWGYASAFITCKLEYKNFCEQYQRFTDTGNYKASAEVVYQFITNETEFEEKHMGLQDVQIESQILQYCVMNGAEWNCDYKVTKILPRRAEKTFTIKVDGQPVYEGMYIKKYTRNNTYYFVTT